MQVILDKIARVYPSLNNVRIGFSTLFNVELVKKLFDLGATVIVTDPDTAKVNALNRVMFERSGSKYRYKPVASEGILREPLEILIAEQEPEKGNKSNAKYRIYQSPPGERKIPANAYVPEWASSPPNGTKPEEKPKE